MKKPRPSPRLVVAAFTAPKPLVAKARKRATRTHGKRGFSKYMRGLISEDLTSQGEGDSVGQWASTD